MQSLPSNNKHDAAARASEGWLFVGIVAGFVALIGAGIALNVLTPEMIAPVCLMALLGIAAGAVSLLRS